MIDLPAALPPDEIERLRETALRAISPIQPAKRGVGDWFGLRRTNAGRSLPPYYLVYFLLVELLNFPHSGRGEKIAWSIPIEFDGSVFFLDHRKLGMGIFCADREKHESQAAQIVSLIAKGTKVAAPFFRGLAGDAVRASRINVRNNSASLFQRYEYLRDRFRTELSEALLRKNEVKKSDFPVGGVGYDFPGLRAIQEAKWIGLAAIDAFFSWTEHIFVHLAVLQGRARTGEEVTNLIGADWHTKFKLALDISDKETKGFYDLLGTIKRQLRNDMAHGAFGKQGEAFSFHSPAGAVPVMLDGHFSLDRDEPFDEEAANATIEKFITHLWTGDREPARLYIEDADMPLILTYASDGTYDDAMHSVEEMETFIEGLSRQMDDAANMDW